jgi:peptidoglycan/LPS O-acetylase OafA/YrhL
VTDGTTRPVARRDIQGLRALAVIAVVLAHALGWPRGGFVGVDVFFVVSGFLITGLLRDEFAATGRISLRGFYARRVRRILPAAVAVLVVVTVAGFFVFNRARADQTLGDAVAAFAVVANWRFAAEGTDYFTAGDAVSPLQHFWSLSVEEQFYLLWPGLLLVVVLSLPVAARRRRAGAAIGAVAVVVVAASAGWAWVQTGTDPTVAYFSTLTRAWELSVGAVLAAAAPLLARLPGVIRVLFGWAGTAGIIWSFLVIDPDNPAFPAPWAALPVAATALVLAGGVGGDPRQRHLFPLTNPVSVFVGDVSYSLYLWHFPVIVFAGMLLPPGPLTTAIVVVAIATLTLSFFYGLERPLHRSPWLRPAAGKTEPAVVERVPGAVAPPEPTPTAARPAVPAASLSSRPAGWVPGSRYYPGSGARQTAAAQAEAAAPARPAEVHPVSPGPAPSAAPALTAPPAAPAVVRPVAPAAWSAWRARFGSQIALSATALALVAGAIAGALVITSGVPVLGPTAPPVAAQPAAVPVGDDPTATVQAEVAAAVYATEWPALHPSLDDVIARSSSDNPARDCFAPDVAPDLGRCTWGSPDAAKRMYLVGDSSAMAYAPAFKRIAEESGGAWRVTTVGLYGCRFTAELIQNAGAGVMDACPGRKAEVRALAAADPADLVVVSNAYTLGRSVDGRDLDAAALQEAAHAEVAGYGAAGRVVYLAPPPHGADLSRCYSPLKSPSECVSAIDPTWHEMADAADAVAAASGDHAISSLPFSCADELCPAFAGELPIRYDENHLTVAYAEHIAPLLRWTLASQGLY